MSKRNTKSSGEYTRIYDSLRGVDFSELASEPQKRYAYLENMYIDYEAGGGIESIPGFRKILTLDGKINRICSHRRDGKEYLAVHAGTKLYYFASDDRDNLKNLTPLISGLSNTRSCYFAYGESLYLLDGTQIIEIDKSGNATSIYGASDKVYVPLTYIDGEKNEPRNLLTDRFEQKFTIKSADELSYGSDGLTFAILDYDAKICGVSGAVQQLYGELHIPSNTMIGNVKFKVTEILDYAFENQTGITKLFTNSNLKTIGHRAFAGCTSLTHAYLSDTVESIGTYSFDHCSSLSCFYVGSGFKMFGSTPFNFCTSLKEILYAKSSDDFEKVENQAAFEDRIVEFNIPRKAVKIAVSIYGGADKITKVSSDESLLDYSFDNVRQMLIIDCLDRELIHGKTIYVSGAFGKAGDGFLSTELGSISDGEHSILQCTLACCFDGRVFLSGNPSLAGVVFYSGIQKNGASNPLYFSVDDYILDGAGGYPVSSILPVGEKLLVFKSGDDGTGSIFYHTVSGHGTQRGYPVSFIRNGTTLTADSSVFMGEGVFVSSLGICAAIDDTSEYPTVNCRSEKISRLLLTEPLSDIRLAEWQGYLAVSSGGRIYLADSRSKYGTKNGYMCEWYYLNGIGTYRKDYKVYRYASKPKNGSSVHPRADEKVTVTVYSSLLGDGTYDYYTSEGGVKYGVYPTDEYEGGVFYPATELFSLGNLLYFGTDCGDLCVFNNDKRGEPPPHIAESADFDSDEYRLKMGTSIHPYYYSFGTHETKYALATVPDDCGLSDLEKNTVRNSATIKFKCMSDCEMKVLTKTDNSGTREICRINSGAQDFYSTDFSSMSLYSGGYASLALKEYERGWLEKQYIITANSFRAPIGIHSLSYRYKIKGKIRNK